MPSGKRAKEEVKTEVKKEMDEESWEAVEPTPCPSPFSYEVPKHTAMGAAVPSSSASAKGHGSVKLHSKELLAALPNLSKEDKKNLQKALKEDEEKQAYKDLQFAEEYLPWMAQGFSYPDFFNQRKPKEEGPYWSTEAVAARQAARAQASSSTTSSQGPVTPEPRPPKKEEDVPKAVRDKELKVFRKQLYTAQLQNGRLVPSKAAPIPTERQAQCNHAFESLRWSANQEGHYAKCTDCSLRSVIYWSSKNGALMVSLAHERPEGIPTQAKVWVREDEKSETLQMVNHGGPTASQVCCRITKTKQGQVLKKDDYSGEVVGLQEALVGGAQALVTEFWYLEESSAEAFEMSKNRLPPHLQTPGLAIADSGCRNSVGGRLWHEAFQHALQALDVPFLQVQEHEVYRFGAGAPVVSTVACLYPVLVHGHWDIIRMSCVDGEAINCPGLIGPSELSRWKAVFRFGERQLELNGVPRPMVLTWTRHPGIHLMDYDKKQVQEAKNFWQSTEGIRRKKILEEDPQSLSFVTEEAASGTMTEEEQSEEEQESEEGSEDGMAFREKRMKQWFDHLQEDLGIRVIDEGEPPVSGSEEETTASEEAQESSSSHEIGIEAVSSDSEDEEQQKEDAQERAEEVVREGRPRLMNKHLRKKLGHHVQEIGVAFKEEQEKKEDQLSSVHFNRHFGDRPKARKRWSVLEVFTWTCAISLMASARGWHFMSLCRYPIGTS